MADPRGSLRNSPGSVLLNVFSSTFGKGQNRFVVPSLGSLCTSLKHQAFYMPKILSLRTSLNINRFKCPKYSFSLGRLSRVHKTRLAFGADGRSKTNPPLPEEYFGGANITTLSDATAAELQSQPLSWSASKVRDSVSRVDASYVKNLVDWIAEQPNKAALGLNINSHLGPDLLVSILTKFPIDLMDLGWGNALGIGPGKYHIPLDGLVVLVGSRGGVCAFVSLLAGHMKKLMKHEPLLKYVG